MWSFPVAVLGWGRGGGASAPSLFVQAPQFFHRLLIIAPPPTRRLVAWPQSVLARTLEPLLVISTCSMQPTYRVAELFAPPTLAASSSHSPTGPPLATEPFLLLIPRSGTVCHRRSHQRHHWTPFAGVWRLICSPCHIRTYNYRNWPTSVSGPQ